MLWIKAGDGYDKRACQKYTPCDIRNPLACGKLGTCKTKGSEVYLG